MLVNPKMPSLKYEREMEPVVLATFKEEIGKVHKNLELRSGDSNAKFIGASPDGLVTCCCCPPSCLKIKCPFSINLQQMLHLIFLLKKDGKSC